MIEQRGGIEDRMLGLAQKARLGDAVEDHRRRQLRARRIEAMVGKLDRQIGDFAPLERGEQGLKPLRVLVEDA